MIRNHQLPLTMFGNVLEQMGSPGRLICFFLLLHFATYDRILAQRHVTTFGQLREVAVNKSAEELISGDFNGDGLADLAAYGGSTLVIYYQSSPPLSWQTSTLRLGAPIRTAASAQCNADRIDDIVLTMDAPSEVRVYLGRQRKGLSLAWRKSIAETSTHVLVANVNSDRKSDLLLWGEKQLGVQLFLGSGDGTYQAPEALMSDFSFSTVCVDDMNDDGIPDIAAGNWISNEVLVYSGFGKLRFADPAVIPLDYEPTFVTTALFNDDAVKDVIVVSTPNRSCQVFAGDGLGGFTPLPLVLLGVPPTAVAVADVNGDGKSDLGALSVAGRCLAIGLNDGKGILEEVIRISGARAPVAFSFLPHGKSHRIDAAILDSATHKIRVALNASVSDSSVDVAEYLTGLAPSGIATFFTRSRTEDVFVGNAASQSISYFQLRSDGSFGGQMAFSTITKPTEITPVWRNDTTAVLLVEDPHDHTSSVVEIHTDDYSHRSYALPVREKSDLVTLGAEAASGNLRIFALEHEPRKGRSTLVEFEQIAPSRFIERTCTPYLPSPLQACVMTAKSQRWGKDICYVRYNPRTRAEDVFRMAQEKPRQYSVPKLQFSVAVPESSGATAWLGDLNGDGAEDLVLNFQDPVNLLLCCLRQKDSSFAAPFVRIPNVTISSEKELQFADVNGDRFMDLLYENSLTKSIFYLPGTGNGAFFPKVRLISTEGVGGFALRHRRRDATPQLLVTDQVQGILRVIPLTGEDE